MRCRLPILYSGGLGRGESAVSGWGLSRVSTAPPASFYYNSDHAPLPERIPQLAAVMGPCIAGGAYLPALSDVILMVEGTSFMGLGGPNLVKGATGQTVGSEELGGAAVHTEVSAVAHYMVENDQACLARLRQLVEELPKEVVPEERSATPPTRLPYELYDLMPDNHRQPYDMHDVLECILDGDGIDEFQPDHAKEMICGTGFVDGLPVGVIANARGMFKTRTGGPPRFGGIVYTESARKVAYFIETMNRHRTPILFVQDVSGFMVGTEAEHSGIIRAGAPSSSKRWPQPPCPSWCSP